jgi:hypothetical protein
MVVRKFAFSLARLLFCFQREIKKQIRLLDLKEWHASLSSHALSAPGATVGFSAKAHYSSIKTTYGRESSLLQGDRRSSLYKFYLRSGNFGLNARLHHGLNNDETSLRKSCKLCTGRLIEHEEHFILHCCAYNQSRHILWLNIEGNLCQAGLFNEWRLLSLSPPPEQFLYLLGRTEEYWHPSAAPIIDRFVRQYILATASKRKSLLSQ